VNVEAQPPPQFAGLTTAEARARLLRHGPNHLVPEERPRSGLYWLGKALADPMALLLVVTGAAYWLLGEHADAIMVLVALVPILLVTVLLELRGQRALEQLRQMTAPRARAWREGALAELPAGEVVPGDLLLLQEGDVVPADGLMVDGAQLALDEAALTGESLPVDKRPAGDPGVAAAISVAKAPGVATDSVAKTEPKAGTPAPAADPTADAAVILAGTTVLSGQGWMRVTVTGGATNYGRIGGLVARIEQPPTPLERVVQQLVRRLGLVAILFCIGLVILGLVRGQPWEQALIAGVSLAMAAIPEEFPMVFTLYLTLGAWRLTRSRALVRRLSGVEALGAVTVICADKTGTLTRGEPDVAALYTVDGRHWPAAELKAPLDPAPAALLEAAVLACEPQPFDPIDKAILQTALRAGLDVAALHARRLERDDPFDPRTRTLAHVWSHEGGLKTGSLTLATKGALEGILGRSRADGADTVKAQAAHDAHGERGMRLLGVAAGTLPSLDLGADGERDRTRFLGYIAMADPLRRGVREAVADCTAAGIRVVMITGDHPATAHAIADDLDLPHDTEPYLMTGQQLDEASDAALPDLLRTVNIFARTRPEQKHRIVEALRADGEVVAMTGDGINDAPALREADVGVAMGQRGTAVARESATLVLLDDNFATIVEAVRGGRRIFHNLQHAFIYLIAFHTPLLVGALLAPLLGRPLLFLPIHLVWYELLVHPTASLVFQAEPGDADLMQRPPRRGLSLIESRHFWRSVLQGSLLVTAVLGLYLWRLDAGADPAAARALALTTLSLGHLGLILAARSPDRPLWLRPEPWTRTLKVIAVVSIAAWALVVQLPALAARFRLAPLSAADWALAAGAAALALTLGELGKRGPIRPST
jgi:Ca2+-transporting ATPase